MADEREGLVETEREACAHCGRFELARSVVICRGCLFVYCADHVECDDHGCEEICRESVILEARVA